MKILIVTEFFPTGKELRFSGGVEARTFYVAKELSKRHKVSILTTKIKGAKDKERLYKVNVTRIGKNHTYQAVSGGILNRLNFIKNSLKEAAKIDADLVEGTNFITHFIAWLIAFQKKIPSVAWYPDVWIGSWIKNAGIIGIFGGLLERTNLKLGFSAYIAISQETKRKLRKFTRSKIEVVSCGVDLQEFQGKIQKTDMILCVSRLAKYKNIKDLILAFALIAKKNSQLRLTIVGRGPLENELNDLSKNLKLQKKVTFKSNLTRKEIVDLFKSAKIFCLPSEVEGFGISVIEAAAAATPFVVSDIQVLKEITKNGYGGLIFRMGDIINLSEQLQKLATRDKLYKEKSKEAILLSKNYQWVQIAKATEKVYMKAIRQYK